MNDGRGAISVFFFFFLYFVLIVFVVAVVSEKEAISDTTPKNPISADIWGGPFFFFFGSNQRERYFSMEHGRWKVARRSLHQLPQPPPETFDDDNPQPPKINWSP